MSSATPSRLYLMRLLTTSIPTAGQPLAFSLGCYLVQMSGGRNVLIDSGMPAEHAALAGMPPVEGRKDVIAHLAELGLQPEDIDVVVCTHFDIDHVGYHPAFARAEFVVQREQYELARGGHPRFADAREYWDHPALRYRLVEGDTELLPGLELIATGGHSPGHQSVLVRLPRTGAVLLAIDAVAMGRSFSAERRAWPIDDDEDQLRASTRKLLAIVERERVGLVVFGHDGRQWEGLTLAPGWYE
jgi:N-acyl homoserine lactone hydrolase